MNSHERARWLLERKRLREEKSPKKSLENGSPLPPPETGASVVVSEGAPQKKEVESKEKTTLNPDASKEFKDKKQGLGKAARNFRIDAFGLIPKALLFFLEKSGKAVGFGSKIAIFGLMGALVSDVLIGTSILEATGAGVLNGAIDIIDAVRAAHGEIPALLTLALALRFGPTLALSTQQEWTSELKTFIAEGKKKKKR